METERLRICFLIGIPILRFDAIGCVGRVVNDLRFLERSGFFLVIFQSKERIALVYGDLGVCLCVSVLQCSDVNQLKKASNFRHRKCYWLKQF